MSFSKKTVTAAVLAGVSLFVACAHVPYAREVKKRPSTGGVIALNPHHTSEDRLKADSLMQTNCAGKDVQVTEEGEVAVGTRTQASSSSSYNNNNNNNTNSGFSLGGIAFGSSAPTQNSNVSSETTTMKEWQISYECVARQDSSSEKPTAKKATGKRKS